ncbi:MotA/TolQ/ExbB proton channel family protein [Desulfotalea psychrophila]|uniref:Related to biopolymer transport protein (ExbB) n=1 Tax=Desulfotalea psychrophila (strain LSv54 / DSM 12343) TaxID=177439 RepID=Q6AIX8_DESPS|nr:MotA/TolQ/ExbB proton channel family protein [Desulfotalea psychrophila]CAG37702.1 related to biopolymer transport protein (ExbB) [Desulfotalea psychrophila LSv54]
MVDNQLLHYLQTGGVTMYPLLACSFFMWAGIFFHLPCWRLGLDRQVDLLRCEFHEKRSGRLRHDRLLYEYLLVSCQQEMKSGHSTIKIFATIAPFLGLFGTVTGMIRTFQSVATFGLANPRALAGGISEAMVTTQFGLLVAVPGVFALYFLHRGASRRLAKIEQITADLVSSHS